MTEYSRRRPTLKLWVRIFLIIVISLGIFLPLVEIYLNSIETSQKKSEKIYTYKITQLTDYKVNLFDNSFVDKNQMGSNKVYISDLVNNIKINFKYNYSGTKATSLKYKYYVKAKLIGESTNNQNNTNETVWEKEYKLSDVEEKNTKDTSGFAINQDVEIDYPKYKEEVNNFKKQFGMSLTTKLKVTLYTHVDGEYENKPISKDNQIVLDIPLGVQAFSITEDYQKENSYNLYKSNTTIKIVNSSYMNACIFITLSSILLLILSFNAIFNIKPKSKYTRYLNKILKKYGQIIVEVETPVKEKNHTVIMVKNFDEMLDLEEELRIPIIFFENIYNYSAIFTITQNDTIYKYILKN